MTNNQPRRWNTYVNHGTLSPISESTKVAVSVDDTKNKMFTYDKKMHDAFIVLSEKFLQFAGSKFGPSEQLFLWSGGSIQS